MAKLINGIEKKTRGRPRTDATPVLLRLQPSQITALDAWIARQPEPRPTRPEAIRRILNDALKGAEPAPGEGWGGGDGL